MRNKPLQSYEIVRKNAICGGRWDITTQEGKVCDTDMKIEILIIVVKGRKHAREKLRGIKATMRDDENKY